MIAPNERRRLISLATSTLLACILAGMCITLTVAAPLLGAPATYTGFLYIPPQACLAGLLAPTALVLAFATAITALRLSWRVRRSGPTGAMALPPGEQT